MGTRKLTFALAFGISAAWSMAINPLHAQNGIASEGWGVVRLLKLETSGIFIEPYDGIIEKTSYDIMENCDRSEFECFSPTVETIEFSVRESNTKTIEFLRYNLQKVMLIRFELHAIEPLMISKRFEILEAYPYDGNFPPDLGKFREASPTGNILQKTYGRILWLEREGLLVRSYEGIFFDKKRNKVQPFSIESGDMALYALDLIKYPEYYNAHFSIGGSKGKRASSNNLIKLQLGKMEEDSPKVVKKESNDKADQKQNKSDSQKESSTSKTEETKKETVKDSSDSESSKAAKNDTAESRKSNEEKENYNNLDDIPELRGNPQK